MTASDGICFAGLPLSTHGAKPMSQVAMVLSDPLILRGPGAQAVSSGGGQIRTDRKIRPSGWGGTEDYSEDSRYVSIGTEFLISMVPWASKWNFFPSSFLVISETWILPGWPWDSIRLAILTVLPQRS